MDSQVFIPDACWYALTPCGHHFKEDDPVFANWKNGEDHIDLNGRLSQRFSRFSKSCPMPGCNSEVAKIFISRDAPELIRQAQQQALPSEWQQDYVVPGCCGQLMTEAQLHQMCPNAYHVERGKVNVAELNAGLNRRWNAVQLTCTNCDQSVTSIGRADRLSAKIRELLPRLHPQVPSLPEAVPFVPPSAPPSAPPYQATIDTDEYSQPPAALPGLLPANYYPPAQAGIYPQVAPPAYGYQPAPQQQQQYAQQGWAYPTMPYDQVAPAGYPPAAYGQSSYPHNSSNG